MLYAQNYGVNFMFYDKFEKLRKEKGATILEVTQNVGIDRTTVYKWRDEGSAPRHDTLVKIANFFNVSVDYLLTEESIDTETNNLKFALWGGDAEIVDDEMLEDVRDFAKMLAQKKRRKMRNENEKKPD